MRHTIICCLALLLSWVGANAQVPCTVDGNSYMALVRAQGLLGINDYVNLVSVPNGGGSDVSTLVDTAALPIPIPLPLRARLVSNSTTGDAAACSASSFSSAADVDVNVFGLVTVTADLIEAATQVSPDGCAAGTKVVNLAISVLGMPIAIPDPLAPNTVIPLGPLGSVTLKEERCSESEATAAIVRVVVNVAVPLLLSERIEVVVSQAQSVAFAEGTAGEGSTETTNDEQGFSVGAGSSLGLDELDLGSLGGLGGPGSLGGLGGLL